MAGEVRPDDVFAEWEDGLPTADDLTPLSQSLIPPELASAFKISPETPRTAADVHRASETTLSSLRSTNPFAVDADEPDPDPDPKKARRDDSAAAEEDQSTEAKNSKKPRLVWTPQLHKRFIDVVDHLGLKSAVPKTIMQLMNVDGLTRENVASHLQKYRLFVRRRGNSDDGPLPTSDHRLFASAQQSMAAAGESSSNAGNDSNSNSGGMGNGNGGNNNNHHHHHSYGHNMGMPMAAMPYHHHHHHPQMMHMPPTMPLNGHGIHTHHHHHNQQQEQYSSKFNKHSNHNLHENQ